MSSLSVKGNDEWHIILIESGLSKMPGSRPWLAPLSHIYNWYAPVRGKGPGILGQIGPTYIAVHKHILSGSEITIPRQKI